MIYKRNYIEIKESEINIDDKKYFELYINGNRFGYHSSKKSAKKYAKFLIETAIEVLSEIDKNNYIDDIWEEYLNEESNSFVLDSFRILTGYNDYQIVLAKYEGDSMEFFLNQFE